MPLLLHSRCPKPVQISGLGTKNPALLRTDIAICWLRKEYSVCVIITKLEQMVTHWNAILFQLDYRSNISRLVCLFLCIKLQLELWAQWSQRKQFSFAVSYGTSMVSYLPVRANSCILFILDFKPSFSNRAETELKCNTGITESLALVLYHIQKVGT